jgi:hypothetical protein
MNADFENINPWAEKLQELTIPEIDPSWNAMQALLDKEMPVAQTKDWRRWALLTILLLLLIGVCNCPGIMKTNKIAEQNILPVNDQPGYNNNDQKKQKTNAIKIKDSGLIKTDYGRKKEISGSTQTSADTKPGTNKLTDNKKNLLSKNTGSESFSHEKLIADNNRLNSKNTRLKKAEKNKVTGSASFNATKKINNRYSNQKKKKDLPEDNYKIVSSSATNQKEKKSGNQKINVHEELSTTETNRQDSNIEKNDSSRIERKSSGNIFSDSVKKIAKADSLIKKQKEIAKKKDSTAKKTIKADSIEDAKGLLLAAGLNQFFPVGNQEKSNFNSSATSGGIGDYIPVPVVRYYIHKWFYLQAEAQFNTPQYTKTLLARQINAATSQDTSKSVFIKKLFYFNVPLSVHYSPVKNLYVGAGLQFSMLTNGVALFQDAKPGVQGPLVLSPADTLLISSKVANFKKDPAYHQLKTYEFRFLFDINYQWKPVTLGLRYNRAFTNFINVRISNSVITQSHNASLQLYLRYTIWDHRKKYLLPK